MRDISVCVFSHISFATCTTRITNSNGRGEGDYDAAGPLLWFRWSNLISLFLIERTRELGFSFSPIDAAD